MDTTGGPVTVAGTAALQRHLDRAAQALAAVAGDRTMCAVGRSGQSSPTS